MSNAEYRKNYKCNESTDYYNRAGHDCYYKTDYMPVIVLVSLILIVGIYFLVRFIRKRKQDKETIDVTVDDKEDKKEKK